MAIYRALLMSLEHPSPETIFETVKEKVPGLSLATIYKTLDALRAAGLVAQVSTTGERKRYDANREQHHHLICTRCERILDYTDPELDAIAPPKVEGWTASAVRVQVFGLCSACKRNRRS
jgi:Fur family peroxide stress response transcriptional regulator